MEFKDLIKTKRLQHHMTMEEVGKLVGVTKATVQRWESGEIKNIRRDKIAKLSAALKCSPAYLMGWEEAKAQKMEEKNNTITDVVFKMRSNKVFASAVAALLEMSDEQLTALLAFIEKF